MKLSWPKVPCIAAFLLVITLLITAGIAEAGPICGDRAVLLSKLSEQYQEVPVGIGVANGNLVELLTSRNGETFSIVVTKANGISCLIAAGDGWQHQDYELVDEGPGA